MYQEIWTRYRDAMADFPQSRRPRIGAVIKEVRVDKGILQNDFTKKVKINESTFKSIENDHQKATTIENLERCAQALDLTPEEIILFGREKDPTNIFAFKKSAPPVISGIRKRKQTSAEWYSALRLNLKNFDVTPISPPINTKKDFFILRINLPAKRSVERLSLGTHTPVIIHVSSGYNLKINYATQPTLITTNQAVCLDGFYTHKIENDDDDQGAVLYLLGKFPDSIQEKTSDHIIASPSKTIHIGKGIETLRKFASNRADKPLSINHLADLSGRLDHMQIRKIARLKGESSVAYWEKIEDLLGAAHISMEQFLDWTRNIEKQPLSIANPKTRTVIDNTAFYGVRIYSSVPPSTGNAYFCGDLLIEGKKDKVSKKSWARKDNAMIGLYVEEGELEITVGKRRGPLPLIKGESIYFDGSLGYGLRNPTASDCKAFFATHPAIPF